MASLRLTGMPPAMLAASRRVRCYRPEQGISPASSAAMVAAQSMAAIPVAVSRVMNRLVNLFEPQITDVDSSVTTSMPSRTS